MRQLRVEKIDHIYREGNKCADVIASTSFDDALDFHVHDLFFDPHVHDLAPDCINSQLCEDANGVWNILDSCMTLNFI
ncbi:hypothetical protein RHMOL_Rhmol01G0041300 [Rhododendron molle]|nr:hypothetical protein RHMOL_Rhmol01G0041300 [Rhododendron molle]